MSRRGERSAGAELDFRKRGIRAPLLQGRSPGTADGRDDLRPYRSFPGRPTLTGAAIPATLGSTYRQRLATAPLDEPRRSHYAAAAKGGDWVELG